MHVPAAFTGLDSLVVGHRASQLRAPEVLRVVWQGGKCGCFLAFGLQGAVRRLCSFF
jgi:hypothetical protein